MIDEIYQFKEKIFEIFKNETRRSLNEGGSLKYDDLCLKTLIPLGFSIPDSPITFLEDWYKNVIELNFINQYLYQNNLCELILHNHENLQLDCGNKLKSIHFEEVSPEDYQLSLEILSFKNNQNWNLKNPFASFFIKLKGVLFRATTVHKSLSPRGESKLYLRKISNTPFSLNSFMNDDISKTILNLVKNGNNILVAGATGSGKTSFLSSLIDTIDQDDHIVVLEDTHEIRPKTKNCSSMLAKDQEGYRLNDLCAHALRMRPDRLILGEMRSHEVIPYTLAANTGHKGLMSTIHADSAPDALSRLTLLFCLYNQNSNLPYEKALEIICSGIDYVVFMTSKKVTQLIRVIGMENNCPLYETLFELESNNTLLANFQSLISSSQKAAN